MDEPLVSIVTPVYNGAEFLGECIESVQAQTYQNWEYIIVDNCSTDNTREIACRYAAQDSRIHVYENKEFLRINANHNAALRKISPESKYVKPVFADDWIFPRCVEELVAVAEANPCVGIVGAYGLQDCDIMWSGLPYPSTVVRGNDLCRRYFIDGLYVFGTGNSLLYRSDLVRANDPFYNEANLHADMETCVVLLKHSNFGFVHQILTFKRTRPGSLGCFTEDINTLIAGHLEILVSHGRDFLTEEEFQNCRTRLITKYYNFLAVSLMRGRRDRKFWEYHRRKLTDTGVGFGKIRLISALVRRVCRAIFHPNETLQKLGLKDASLAD